MSLPHPLCLWRTLWYGAVHPGVWWRGYGISGCTYQDEETHAGCTVTVGRCPICGGRSITWHHGLPDDRELQAAQQCCMVAALHPGAVVESGPEP
jgi:hypothetical protein